MSAKSSAYWFLTGLRRIASNGFKRPATRVGFSGLTRGNEPAHEGGGREIAPPGRGETKRGNARNRPLADAGGGVSPRPEDTGPPLQGGFFCGVNRGMGLRVLRSCVGGGKRWDVAEGRLRRGWVAVGVKFQGGCFSLLFYECGELGWGDDGEVG